MRLDLTRLAAAVMAAAWLVLSGAIGATSADGPIFPLQGRLQPFTGHTRTTAPATPGAYQIANPVDWYYEWPVPRPAFPYSRFNGQRLVGQRQEPGFGACRPSTQLPRGCARPHRGLDIYAHYGTPILAPERGVIVSYQGSDVFTPAGQESKNGGAGRLFRLQGDSGHAYRFMHTMGFSEAVASQAGVAKDFGETAERAIHVPVEAGEVIGYVGRTGGIINPHLHLEVARDGRDVDPASLTWRFPHEAVSSTHAAKSVVREIRSRRSVGAGGG